MATADGIAGPLVPGEYDQVARASSDLAALRLAHSTPITKKAACAMLASLAAEYLSPADASAMVVKWGATRGRGGWHVPSTMVPVLSPTGEPYRRAIWDRVTGSYVPGKVRMRRKLTRGPDGRCLMVPYVALPSNPMGPDGAWHTGRTSLLRVGLVLHEFAHVLTVRQCGRYNPHGQTFTDCLDRLIAAWVAAQACQNAHGMLAGAR